VTVVDKLTSKTITKTISIPPNPFFLPITANIGNAITPNGDGINDYWRVKDNGKKTYAYNATHYKLWIYDQNGLMPNYPYEHSTIAPGFDDNEIKWIPSPCVDATYYYILQIRNCANTNSPNYSGAINVDCSPPSQQKRANYDINKDNVSNSQLKIIPNPVYDNLQIIRSDAGYHIFEINLTNSLGVLYLNIPHNKTTFSNNILILDLSNLPLGIYFIDLNTSEGNIRRKIIKFD
jgi:hypothetical protein